MIAVVGNVAYASALLTGVLGLVEWLLPRQAKHRLRDHTTAAWMWLEEQRSHAYAGLLRGRAGQFVLFGLGLVPIGLAVWIIVNWGMLAVAGAPPDFYTFVTTTLTITVGAALLVAFLLRGVFGRLVAWTIGGPYPPVWLLKALLVSVVAFLVLCVPFLFYENAVALIGTLPPPVGLTFFVAVIFVYSLALVLFGGYALMFALVAAYATAILALFLLFKTLALIFDRISSSEKGVLAGLAVALTAIGSICKAYLS